MRFASLVLLAALALVPTARAADVTINVQNFAFVPAHVVVNPGDTVTLTLQSATATTTYSGLVQADMSFSIDVPGADLVVDTDTRIEASVSTEDAAGNIGSAIDPDP